MKQGATVFVAGQHKALGRAVMKAMEAAGYDAARPEPDLADQGAVKAWFRDNAVDAVVLCAGKAGGIGYNIKHPADLITDNLLVQTNVIRAAHEAGVDRLLYLASSCVYPKHCPQPIREEYLFSGALEPTNQAYATAKIAGIELCRAYTAQHGVRYIPVVPTNYFGPGDDFSPENSHVIGALIRRLHEAREAGAAKVEIWGSGNPRREFIYTEDVGDACLFLLNHYQSTELINVGSGFSLSIAELAGMIREVVGYDGDLVFDTTRPDGMPVKELDGSRLASLGWKAATPFTEALEATYRWFLATNG